MTKSLAKQKVLTALVHASTTLERLRRDLAAQDEPWVYEATVTLDNLTKSLDAKCVAVEEEF